MGAKWGKPGAPKLEIVPPKPPSRVAMFFVSAAMTIANGVGLGIGFALGAALIRAVLP